MKKSHRLILQSSLILGGGLLIYQASDQSTDVDPAVTDSLASKRSTVVSRHAHNHAHSISERTTVALELAKHGFLWEKSSDPALQRRITIPADTKAIADFSQWKEGQKVSLRLSSKFPAIEGEVTHTGVQQDGTVVAHLSIPGEPIGHMILQENEELNFFEGHITYANHPVAYRLEKQNQGLTMSRISFEDLVCSQADHDQLTVDSGLPVLGGVLKARGGNGGGGGGKPNKAPRLSVVGASTNEGDSGTSQLSFAVTLSKAATTQVTVNYATSAGSATAGSDYIHTSGSLTFAAGVTSKSVAVTVNGDTTEESDETFSLNLSNLVGADMGTSSATGTINDDDTVPDPDPGSVPVLNSRPSSMAVAYLDMDGQSVSNTSWNSGKNRRGINVVGVDTNYTVGQMTEIWKRVAEDYAAFDINVTTDESVYLSAPSNRRIRCIITPDWEWFGQAGGVAYLNSFTWTGDTPCWVFSSLLADHPKYIADATSHEIGHTLGLNHDGRTSPSEGYYEGHGSGVTGWAPIMGVGYYQNLIQWSKGEYAYANNHEDDLSIITGQNGFGYRADDHGNINGSASELTASGASGVIENQYDTDVFTFDATGGNTTLSATGATPDTNLDIVLQLVDSSGTVVASSNPENGLNASISATLTAGTYYVRVTGTGKGSVSGSGYSAYGSQGEYNLTLTQP